MDFRESVVSSLDAILQSGAVEKLITAQLEKTIEEIVKNELRTHSDFGKRVTEAVRGTLNFGDVGLPAYNNMILAVLRRKIDAHLEGVLKTQLDEQLTDLLQTPPAELPLSKLLADFKQWVREHSDSREITFSVDLESKDFPYITLDPQRGKRKYEGAYRLHTRDWRIIALHIPSVGDASKGLFIGRTYGFERDLLQLYVAKTKLVPDIDLDDINTYIADQDEEEDEDDC